MAGGGGGGCMPGTDVPPPETGGGGGGGGDAEPPGFAGRTGGGNGGGGAGGAISARSVSEHSDCQPKDEAVALCVRNWHNYQSQWKWCTYLTCSIIDKWRFPFTCSVSRNDTLRF